MIKDDDVHNFVLEQENYDYECEEIEEDETLFAFESNFIPSGMTEKEWNDMHK
jgi:hypothetical protein